jgi:hypothetical protein
LALRSRGYPVDGERNMSFNVGNKVIPTSKSILPYPIEEYKKAKRLGKCLKKQGYLYIIRINNGDAVYILGENITDTTGDFFLKRDLVHYDKQIEFDF